MLPARLFAEAQIEERTVELGDGTSEVLHFRLLANSALERYALWTNSADEDVQAKAHVRLIAMGLCNPDGTDAITEAEADRIKRPVMLRLISALLEVNGFGGRKTKKGNG